MREGARAECRYSSAVDLTSDGDVSRLKSHPPVMEHLHPASITFDSYFGSNHSLRYCPRLRLLGMCATRMIGTTRDVDPSVHKSLQANQQSFLLSSRSNQPLRQFMAIVAPTMLSARIFLPFSTFLGYKPRQLGFLRTLESLPWRAIRIFWQVDLQRATRISDKSLEKRFPIFLPSFGTDRHCRTSRAWSQ